MDTQRPIGFWLKLVDMLITEQFARSLEEHGVTRLQWQLMNVLDGTNATGEELITMLAPFVAEHAGQDEPTDPQEHLSELVESGWVEISQERYQLTPRGTTSLVTLAGVVEDVRTKAAAGISPAAYETAVQTLERMATNLGWTGAE